MKQKISFLVLSFLFFCFTFAGSFFGCAGKAVDENDPQALYKEAEENIADKKYLQALENLKLLKNKFPYNHLSVTAQLRIADVYYLQESYIEAASSYEAFRDLHPKYPKADFVLFRIGESYFNQLPSSVDRDLSPASKAMNAYRELITLYPKSEYVDDAQKHLKESIEKLAGKEKYIGDFYYKREMFDSAAKRYEKITSTYSGTQVEEDAYWYWAKSLMKLSENKETEQEQSLVKDEAKHVYRVYLARFPKGQYSEQANEMLKTLGGN